MRLYGMLSLAVFSVAPAADQATFCPRHVALLTQVRSAVISPDGGSVAYGLAVPRHPLRGDDGPAWCELHVVDRSGRSRPFVTGQVNCRNIAFRPDGKALLFVARRGKDSTDSLYAISLGGGEARKILSYPTGIQRAEIGPKGTRVCFLARCKRPEKEEKYRQMGFNQIVYEEDRLPTKAFVAPLGGGSPRALKLPGSISAVKWSPTGRFLAVVWAPTPLVDDSYVRRRICIVDTVTGAIVMHIKNPGKLGRIAWSPDERHLAFVSAADEHDPREGRLMVCAFPGDGSFRDLLPLYEAHVSSIAWKDHTTLLYVAYEGTGVRVGTVDLRGTRKTLIAPGGPILSGLSLSGNGTAAAFVGHTPTHPPEVYYFSFHHNKLTRLTVSNPFLSSLAFARQEVVTWKAKDGLELQGILIYPLNWRPGLRYPLILCVHGGPEAHVSNGWLTSYSRLGQVAAARGFAVFYPNYRGSTGRGVAFSKLGQADAAGGEFQDLVDAADHLVELGRVDPKRVGITGGSYGGYASAWGSTYFSDRFAASVMFIGISDAVSKMGTTDIPDEMYYVHHLKRLWDDWDYFLNRSPIRYVERCRTPTLILHGTDDTRVHPSQSLELYRHLTTLAKAPVRLIFYPGEGHGNRRACSRFDYNLRALRWFEHYLKGPGGAPPDWHLDYDKAW